MISIATEVLLEHAIAEGYEDVQDWLINASTYNQEEVIIRAVLEYGKRMESFYHKDLMMTRFKNYRELHDCMVDVAGFFPVHENRNKIETMPIDKWDEAVELLANGDDFSEVIEKFTAKS